MLEEDCVEGEVLNSISILFAVVLVIDKVGFGVGCKNALEIFKFKVSGLLLEELLDFLEVALEDKGLVGYFVWMQTYLLELFFVLLLFQVWSEVEEGIVGEVHPILFALLLLYFSCFLVYLR